jgi:hypothetical protein
MRNEALSDEDFERLFAAVQIHGYKWAHIATTVFESVTGGFVLFLVQLLAQTSVGSFSAPFLNL